MLDLSTTYLGLKLQNPLVPSASPLSKSLDTHEAPGRSRRGRGGDVFAVRRADHAREQRTRFLPERRARKVIAEALSYFPDLGHYNVGPEGYLEQVRQAKAALEIPIIASLNGISTGGWIRYAKLMRGSGRGCAGTQRVLHPDRFQHERRGCGEDVPGPGARCEAEREDSGRGEDWATSSVRSRTS